MFTNLKIVNRLAYSTVLRLCACLYLGLAASPLLAYPPPQGFTDLLSESDLSGWYGLDPHAVPEQSRANRDEAIAKFDESFRQHWQVKDGVLVNDGLGPYATTDAQYGDYELLIEYQTTPEADSGIYLRGIPQVQIWNASQPHNPNAPNRHPYLGSGGLFNNQPRTLGRDPLILADKPIGQWNSLAIRHIGDRVWVKLNGKEVVIGAALENFWNPGTPAPSRGPIMLQTHGGMILWRNIFIREIPASEAEQALAIPPVPNPTAYNISYGPHPKQLIHFWQAESSQPTPLVLFIHGGGWVGGGRLTGLTEMLPDLLKAGISVASVEYRFILEATADGVVPPVQAPLHDAARALQLIRSKAAQWNIDSARIGASGTSAGACTSLWLAFHDDLADPSSDDPIARQSTRLSCAAVLGAQTTLDPKQMREWTPNSRYGGHAFGFMKDPNKRDADFEEFYQNRDQIIDWIQEYSPYAHVSSDDPPVFLAYSSPPAIGQEQTDPTHTANFGVKLQEHCHDLGTTCQLYYPEIDHAEHRSMKEYLINKLRN